jgi:putative two-component system response regulator
MSGRIVKVADVFDALTSRRCYKEPWSIERAMEWLQQNSRKQFDPQLIDAFLRLHASGVITAIMRESGG